ncbi:MAG: iron-sulfur cluster-binding domain-containing protein [Bacteroidetes bacterium]|nr:iron-sulfur cluster-binding domain-containing protein [Bacteroidota bacterium]MBS1740259.1 iron-sulfur cluster-binding domain-containing protein [Bacteroidota bacterium]
MFFKPNFQPAFHRATVSAIMEEAPDVHTLQLLFETPFEYRAGQFLTLVFEDLLKEDRRSYSFSSAPAVDPVVSITIKRISNGRYSRPLIESLRVGDQLSTTSATGLFILPKRIETYHQYFFFAAGIGITPIFSLLKELLFTHPDVSAVLIYSNSSPLQTVFENEINELQKRFQKRFVVHYLFSNTTQLNNARLSKWLLPQLLERYALGNKKEHLFYVCGPFAYMRMVRYALQELEYDDAQIRKENFDTSRPIHLHKPSDQQPHQVTLNLGTEKHHFESQYPLTILQTAKQLGIPLPYSCETGRCGSCMLRCTKGKVWMSYNEVLTEKDLSEGKVLTCVGYPIGGDIWLEG